MLGLLGRVAAALLLLACSTAPTNAFVDGGVPRYDSALSRALESLPAVPIDRSWLERRLRRRVQLHELQHAIDWRTQRAFKPFEPLVAAMGVSAVDLRSQLLATMELSAWTSTFARDFAWFDLVTGVVAAHDEGLPTGYAVAFLVDALARRFEPSSQPALRDGVIDRDRLAAHVLMLATHGTDIAGVARALWQDWFGVPLEQIRLR
jgi:hypothetical protein